MTRLGMSRRLPPRTAQAIIAQNRRTTKSNGNPSRMDRGTMHARSKNTLSHEWIRRELLHGKPASNTSNAHSVTPPRVTTRKCTVPSQVSVNTTPALPHDHIAVNKQAFKEHDVYHRAQGCKWQSPRSSTCVRLSEEIGFEPEPLSGHRKEEGPQIHINGGVGGGENGGRGRGRKGGHSHK